MMFRRLYWVTEEVRKDGSSSVTGVYTSIPDLVKGCIHSRNGQPTRLRLTLVKLDSCKGPLGVWEGPGFEGLRERLQEFVQTDEFSLEHCQLLVEELAKPSASAH